MNSRRSHRRLCWLTALCLLCAPMGALGEPSQNLPPLPEDLIPALRPILVSALRQSPQMIEHNIDIAQAEGARIQNAAGLLPSVSSTVQYGSDTTSAAGGFAAASSLGMQYSVSANQPIYHWGALKARAAYGRIGVKIAERQYAEAYRQLVVSLRSQFLALTAKKIALRNIEFALQQAEEAVTLADEKLKTKSISEGIVSSAKWTRDLTRLDRDRAVEDLENSRRLFLLSSGQTDLGVEAISDEVPRPSYAPEAVARLLQRFSQSAGEGVYAILNLRDSIKQAQIDYRIARVQLLPQLGLSAWVNQSTQTQMNGNSLDRYVTRSSNYDLVASWSIFDGFATRGAKLSALSRKRNLERSLRTSLDQIMVQASDEEKQLGFSWRSLEFAQQSRDAAEATIKILMEDVRLGRSSSVDVGPARQSFFQSEYSLAVARSDFLNRWSEFVSTLCVDPMLDFVPQHYLDDAK